MIRCRRSAWSVAASGSALMPSVPPGPDTDNPDGPLLLQPACRATRVELRPGRLAPRRAVLLATGGGGVPSLCSTRPPRAQPGAVTSRPPAERKTQRRPLPRRFAYDARTMGRLTVAYDARLPHARWGPLFPRLPARAAGRRARVARRRLHGSGPLDARRRRHRPVPPAAGRGGHARADARPQPDGRRHGRRPSARGPRRAHRRRRDRPAVPRRAERGP